MKRFEDLIEFKERGQSTLHVIGTSLRTEYLAMSMAILKPGERILEHTHKKAEEVYVLLKGKSQVTAGNKAINAKGLTFFRFPAQTNRGIVNNSREEAMWFFIGAPIDEYLSVAGYGPRKRRSRARRIHRYNVNTRMRLSNTLTMV